MRITVERPLRVHWEVNDDTIAAVEAHKAIRALTEDNRQTLADQLRNWGGMEFEYGSKDLKNHLPSAVGHLDGSTKKVEKAILDGLTVRDPDDPIQTKRNGDLEADPDLRDQENVPLPDGQLTYEADVTARLETAAYRTAVDEYVETEVHPYVPDAWTDYAKTKVGYEIPLTRHFYNYVPPRPLDEIDAEIKTLEAEIQELLREVTE